MSHLNLIKTNNKGKNYGQINSSNFGVDPYSHDNDVDIMKYGQTPDALLGKGGSSIAIMEYDNEMEHKVRRPFNRDDFLVLITDTYNEFYGKFKDQFNPDEYLQCVDDSDLIGRFNAWLEESESNILTPSSMPWLDLGNIPTTHSFMRNESQQVYYIPRNRNPDMVYVRYSMIFPKYYSRQPKKRFDESNLPKRDINIREFVHTLNLASDVMKKYRGKIQTYDKIGYGIIALGALIIILLGVGTNSDGGNWGNMVLYVLLYFIFVPIIYKVSKCFQCKYLRQAHFALAVVCRAENNRYYLTRGVEVRPGYLARWLEFNVLDKSTGEKPLEIIQKRHAFAVKETQKNVEMDHQKYMDGVNRDFTEQAIKLRIQIEEAKLGRELTGEEKQVIINSQLKQKADRMAADARREGRNLNNPDG
jgi:hypothetical protein